MHFRLGLLFSVWVLIAQTQAQTQTFISPKVAVVEAQILIDSGEYEEAIEYLETAIQWHPNNDMLLSLYGDALYENRQILEAEVAFRRALEINPLNALAARRIEVIRSISCLLYTSDAADD